MANQLSGNPWVIDTAAATVLLDTWADIRLIRWVGAGVIGDECSVTDQNSRVIFSSFAATAKYKDEVSFEDRQGLSVNGLIVPTLASGKVYIYFDR